MQYGFLTGEVTPGKLNGQHQEEGEEGGKQGVEATQGLFIGKSGLEGGLGPL
jgi:hypothetical protein